MQPADGASKALAFANGLRKNITAAGRRWAQRSGGASDLAQVIASVDGIVQRLQAAPASPEGEAAVAACISDLRAVLEWTTYQSAALQTAQALTVARKTRAFAERFGLLENPAASLSLLTESEESLIENVRAKNEYMTALAARHPHLAFPAPLVRVESLMPSAPRPAGRLDLIQKLMKSAKKKK